MSNYRKSFDFYMSAAQQKASDDLMYSTTAPTAATTTTTTSDSNDDHHESMDTDEVATAAASSSSDLGRSKLSLMYPEGVQATSLATMAKMHSTFIEICQEVYLSQHFSFLHSNQIHFLLKSAKRFI